MPPTEGFVAELNSNTIIFNTSKNELYKITDNYKTLHRKLKVYWKVITIKEEITFPLIKGCALVVLPGSRAPFTLQELDALQSYLDDGGNIFILLAEGNLVAQCNINIFLERYGIVQNSDCVVRTHYYKYFHPKECYISDSDVNKILHKDPDKDPLHIIYPHGATLNVSRPSVVGFTSGITTFPLDRPLAALYCHSSGGKVAVIGSGEMFTDKYIDKEHNDKLREMFVSFLTTTETVKLNPTEHDDIDTWEYQMVPDIAELAERPRACLTDAVGNSVPIDYTKLFETKLFSINTDMVPDALKLYEKLDVKHSPLKLISPQFEAPLPALQAAVFPPSFRDLQAPPLELFDLDDAFSSEFSRLAQFTNKYLMTGPGLQETDKELDFYIQECSKIVNLEESSTNPKEILYTICVKCAQFKNIDTIK
ncbi:Intraflagellar transport 52 [Carabus blaptoides fortunei]